LVSKAPIQLGLFLLAFATLLYVQHVFSLMPLYLRGQIASRPDAKEALASSVTWSLIHIVVLGLWVLLWLWHRRSLRRNKELANAIDRPGTD
jgi:hypothetical protein